MIKEHEMMTDVPEGAVPVHDMGLVGEVDISPELSALLDGGGVSTEDDPELAGDASAAAMERANPMPEMEDPAPGMVVLPGGWLTTGVGGAKIARQDALVRELTGRDEEQLSRIDPAKNMPQFLGKMLELGVEEIGGVKPTKEVFRSLLIGDREALMLGVRIATYGDNLPLHITCPSCDTEEDLEIVLSEDVPVKTLADPLVREFDVTLRDGRLAHAVLPTVGVQDDVWAAKRKSASESRTLSLSMCIESIDGKPVNYETVLDLGIADRQKIEEVLIKNQPGPDYGAVSLPCGSCGENFPLRLDLADLFL